MDKSRIHSELRFKTSKSSGPGGQHVNKVSTRVSLEFEPTSSQGLSDLEKERLLLRWKNRIDKNGIFHLHCDETRSQHKNKDLVITRFFKVLEQALSVPKKRKKTKPSRASKEKRKRDKQKAAQKKLYRKKPNLDG